MELTDKERKAANSVLEELGMSGSVDENVGYALEAYVQGNASDDLKRFLRAAGFELIGEGIWSKLPSMMEKENTSTKVQYVTVAREILVRAKEAGYYPNDPPTDEQELLGEAQEVTDYLLCQEPNEEIDAIIDLSKSSFHASIDDFPTVPMDDYDGMTITKLKLRIDAGDFDPVLDKVIDYENTKNKPRVRVLGYVQKRKEALEKEEEPETEEAPEGEAEDTTPSAIDTSEENGTQEGERDSEEATSKGGGVEEFSGSGHIPDDDLELSSEQEYQIILIEAEAEIKNRILHTPPEPSTKDLDLPHDLTQLSDAALQKAYGSYNALAYRVNYKLLLEEAKLRRVKLAVKELRSYLFSEAVKYDEHNHQRTNADITSEIEQNDVLKNWIKRESVLEMNVEAYRSQRDGLYREVDMLSRLETMRAQEADRSGHR